MLKILLRVGNKNHIKMKTYAPIIIVLMIITQPVKAEFFSYYPSPSWIYPTNNIQVLQTTKNKHYDGVYPNSIQLLDNGGSYFGFISFGYFAHYLTAYPETWGLPVSYASGFMDDWDDEHVVYLMNPSIGYINPYPKVEGVRNEFLGANNYPIIPPIPHISGSVSGLAMGIRISPSVYRYGVAAYSYLNTSNVLKYGMKIFAYDNAYLYYPNDLELYDIPMSQFNINTQIIDIICLQNSYCIISKNNANSSKYRIDTYDYNGNYHGFAYRRMAGTTMNYSKFSFIHEGDYFITIAETNDGINDKPFIDKIYIDPTTHLLTTGTTNPASLNIPGSNSVNFTGKFELFNTSHILIEGYVPATNKRVIYAINKNSFTGTSFIQERQVLNNNEPFMFLHAISSLDYMRTYSIDAADELIIKNYEMSFGPFQIIPSPTCFTSAQIAETNWLLPPNTLDYYLTGAIQIVGAFGNNGLILNSLALNQSLILQADYDFITCSGYKSNEPETIESIEKIDIYPNPANDHLTIESFSNNSLLTIYDLSGKIFLELQMLDYKMEIPIDHLQNGIYLIKIDSGNSSEIQKFVKLD